MTFELWLIRHGETEWSRSGAHTSRTDLALTAAGERSAEQLRPFLEPHKFALLLSSPLRRARDTARLAGFDPETTDDLREWDYGEYEGRTTTEIHQADPAWSIWSGRTPGGETPPQVAARADRVIARASTAGGDVAVFGHGHMLRVLAARWLEMPAQAGRFFALSTGSVSILAHERENRVIRMWNWTPRGSA